ncbi:beta-galactosidase family protein [Paenarthrobacter sp. NPDC089316]|uniref:glycoside hydrolase family 35 protein n=1 Tax=unclassified Paenarthrobacter TaxID=2634190 RepID=UPI00343D1CBA
MSHFDIGEHDFMLDGEPHRIISGALHYFRVHPEHWADRIRKARQMGLNAIETYIPWNAHAPLPGVFDTSGILDLARFLDLVDAEGMHAIVRPGPYICAEWDNGGLPAWLFDSGANAIRVDDSAYLEAIREYFNQLAPILVPRQIHAGGPIILVQIENEYGAYGDDRTYLEKLVRINQEIGLTVPFTTVDQPEDHMLRNGSLPGLHKTGSFGSRATERLATLRRHQPSGPLMCSEFWVGWFDHWGAHHHTTPAEQAAEELDVMLEMGASVNIYMFHGGTNFGLTNGANHKGVYQPTATSYDYDAPLDEAGNPTAKYWALRDVISKYSQLDDADVPVPSGALAQAVLPLNRKVPLWDGLDHLGRWDHKGDLPTHDDLEHYSGYSVYCTEVALSGPGVLTFDAVRDRAQVFLNGQPVGTLARDHHEKSISLPRDAAGTLQILVEDQGRVNYGPKLGEPKGLVGKARINGQSVPDWRCLPLDLAGITSTLSELDSEEVHLDGPVSGPAFVQGEFEAGDQADAFLSMSGWTKGVVWINDFCLGRYWSRGPQTTLYVPGPVLRRGTNSIVVFELHGAAACSVALVPALGLGHTES